MSWWKCARGLSPGPAAIPNRRTRVDAARTMPPLPSKMVRAAQPLPQPRPAIDRAPDIHLHLHGLAAEDVAAIIREQQPAARPAIEED